MFIKKISLVFLMLLSLNSFARRYEDNQCSQLVVQISNSTQYICRVDVKYLHGNLSKASAPPKTIMSGDTKSFIMEQTLIGPEVQVMLDCDQAGKAVLNTKQDLCFLSSGSIKNHIMMNSGLNIMSDEEQGSFFWSRHGVSTWSIW